VRDAPADRTGAHLTIIRAVRAAAIIPAFNEEASLPLVLQAIPFGLLSEVIVLDNGSTDDAARLARAHGATVLSERRRGYGRACLAGIDDLRVGRPDFAVFLDADDSDHPEEGPLLLEPLRRGEADLVIGARARDRREPGSMPPQAIIGNWLATRRLRLLHGGRPTDLGPFRAIRFESLLALGMRDPDFG
jgi:glycosyltransferase involved in cell wall biosynthesis